MRNTLISLTLLVATGGLAACDSDAERGLVGAGAGAAVSAATGGEPLTGALIGGVAGVFCDDLGVCN